MRQLASVAGKGIAYNATLEQMQTSFEVMTGSAEKAAEVVDRLRTMGAETPFEMLDLAGTTQLLMQYGFTADEAIDRMSMLGDIAQGNTEAMTSIAMGYAQMSSAGKVNLQDIKQMINGGVPNINGWLRNTKYWGDQYIDEGADEFGFNYFPLGVRYMTQGFQCWSMRCQMRVPLLMAGAKPVEYPSAAGGRINVVIKDNQSMTTALANIDTGQSVLPFRCVKNY